MGPAWCGHEARAGPSFLGGRGRRRGGFSGVFHLPTGIAVDLIPRHARVDRHNSHLLRQPIRFEHAQVGDEPGRPFGLDSKAGPVIAALAWPSEVTKSSLSTKPRLLWLIMMKIPRTRSRSQGRRRHPQPHLGLSYGPTTVVLRLACRSIWAPPRKPTSCGPLAAIAEHFRHRHGGERGVAQFAVADRERQDGGFGGDGAGLVDQRDARRMGGGAPDCRPPMACRWPTKHTSLDLRARDAATVIISVGVKLSVMRRP